MFTAARCPKFEKKKKNVQLNENFRKLLTKALNKKQTRMQRFPIEIFLPKSRQSTCSNKRNVQTATVAVADRNSAAQVCGAAGYFRVSAWKRSKRVFSTIQTNFNASPSNRWKSDATATLVKPLPAHWIATIIGRSTRKNANVFSITFDFASAFNMA